ncbi:MAG: hypothetical protein KDC38_15640, partial [Planctomycetes bacterium]|nr:hypothetical protein [Planctomycetota bacterium]
YRGESAASQAARESFADRLRSEVSQRESPWSICHALLAFGPEFSYGEPPRRAIETLVEAYVQRDGSRVFVTRHRGAAGLGEQHPYLVLKTLAEVAPDDPIAAPVIAELLATSRHEVVLPTGFESTDDLPWVVTAYARLRIPPDEAIRKGGPTPIALAREILGAVEAGDRIVEKALAKEPFDRPPGSAPPAEAGTYAYTCGGQHMIQALLAVDLAGWWSESERARVEERLRVFRRRIESELEFRQREYELAVRSGKNELEARTLLAMFSVKLLGHGLEIIGSAIRQGIAEEGAQGQVERLRSKLLGIFRSLDDDLDSERTLLPSLRRRFPVLWELWFGDGCHALRGLSMTDAVGR